VKQRVASGGAGDASATLRSASPGSAVSRSLKEDPDRIAG